MRYNHRMKYLIFFLFPCLAFADVQVQRVDQGYIFVIDSTYCMGMPQNVDLNAFPDKLTPVVEASKAHSWPEPIGDAATKCAAALTTRHIVAPWRKTDTTRAVYEIVNGKKSEIKIGVIPVGTVCGAFVQCYYSDCRKSNLSNREVILNGKTGVTVCTSQSP